MPRRKLPLTTDKTYHVYNIAKIGADVFMGKRIPTRAKEALKFYQFKNPPLKLSHFVSSSSEKKEELTNELKNSEKLVEILSYCLMPDHFHIILLQKLDGGISEFMSKFQNSLTRYANTRLKRKGNLFGVQFKAREVESETQLKELHRYIHLEPFVKGVVKSIEELKTYEYSSVKEYISGYKEVSNIIPIAKTFTSQEDYLNFLFYDPEVNESLKKIKPQTFDV